MNRVILLFIPLLLAACHKRYEKMDGVFIGNEIYFEGSSDESDTIEYKVTPCQYYFQHIRSDKEMVLSTNSDTGFPVLSWDRKVFKDGSYEQTNYSSAIVHYLIQMLDDNNLVVTYERTNFTSYRRWTFEGVREVQ